MADDLASLRTALQSRYTVERELGRGGMGTVFLAEDRKHRRRVAIKVLRPEVSTPVGAERFLREIEIAASMSHPHILPLHDSGQANGLLYYVMPHVEGESLRDRLTREGRLPVDEAVRIARQVASALAYAHARGIVHRDIKPENILLSTGMALVSDFGIARAITAAADSPQLSTAGIVIGTPAYMSPEQASGVHELDGRSDVYSLGCVLYEMLAGEPPFAGPSVHTILARHVLDPVPDLRSVRATIPESLERVVLKALAKVPADRFGDATQFSEALARPGLLTDGAGASIRDVAKKALHPLVVGVPTRAPREEAVVEPPPDVWKSLADAGWFGCLIPEEFGGNARGALAMTILLEDVARQGVLATLPISTATSATCLARSGNASARRQLLAQVARGEVRICVAVTEEATGFNLFALNSSARRDGDYYIINGSKTYVSGFDLANHVLLVARTLSLDDCQRLGLSRIAGLSLFLVETSTPGISNTPIPTRNEDAVRRFQVDFTDVRVPAKALVGEENAGAVSLFPAFNVERLLYAALLLGTAQFCLDVACAHARKRKVFGDTPIGQYQAIQHPLADVKIRQDAVRLMVRATAEAVDRGDDPSSVALLANSTKYLAAELGTAAVDAALDALGGKGFREDTGLIQLWGLMRLFKLSPISDALILNDVAERVLGLPRAR